MAPKSLVLAAALLVVVTAAAGQVPRAAGLGLGANPSINTSVLISGVVPCGTNSNNVATVFPNAGVQLVCGGKVVSSATADGSGAFRISMVGDGVSKDLLKDLLLRTDDCKVVVVTPLASCDASLAGFTGTLTAPLTLLGIDSGSVSGLGVIGFVGQIIAIVTGLIGGILSFGTQTFSLI